MNETLKVLESRRSCRKFKPDLVKDDELDAIIKAGTYAATGMGKQSPIIIAVTDKKQLVKLITFCDGKPVRLRLQDRKSVV